jgi:HTH-type transcriptional regulator/antitoxin HigA
MEVRIIKTEEEYVTVLARIEVLMDAASGSPEEDELVLLGMLVERYEEEHYPIDLPDPVEAIKFFMEQKSLKKADMVPYFGHISKVSEVLNGKRELSKTMIRKLVEGLAIPPEILLGISSPRKGTIRYPQPSDQAAMVAENSDTK